MRVLVIGGGGREHAIIRKLKESPRATQLFAMPGNAGIAQDAVCIPGSANDVEAIVAAAKEYEADLVVVAPDDPLVLGAVDKLREAGIPVFGPGRRRRRHRGQQSLRQGPDEKVRHPHRGLPGVP